MNTDKKIEHFINQFSSIKQFELTRSEALSNCKIKQYPNGDISILVCSEPIFNGSGVEKQKKGKKEKFEPIQDTDKCTNENTKRAQRRAKSHLRDLILCNKFEYFITLTLSQDKINRTDYTQIIKKLNSFLNNNVQRKGLQYILVPEFHKDGSAIHFHGLINSALEVKDSGTVSVDGVKKPVKMSTYKKNYKGKFYHKVYNIPAWEVGFSTAIPVYGEQIRVSRYMEKYLEKDFTKVGGRYYLHSRNLQLPVVNYADVDYNLFEGNEFTLDGVNYRFKWLKLSSGSDADPLAAGAAGRATLDN